MESAINRRIWANRAVTILCSIFGVLHGPFVTAPFEVMACFARGIFATWQREAAIAKNLVMQQWATAGVEWSTVAFAFLKVIDVFAAPEE